MPLPQSAFTAARDEGAPARRQITQFIIRRCTKGVENGPALSVLVLLPLTMGLDHLKQWLWLLQLQIISAAARDKGALGGKFCHCPCFEFVEMEEQGAKKRLFYNVVTNSGCWDSKSGFDIEPTGEWLYTLFFVRFKGFKMGPKWTTQILWMLPPEGSFHKNGWDILTKLWGSTM